VGKEVYDEFKARHQDIDEYCKWLNDDNLKIDLQRFIKRTMINQGIREKNICMSEICTKCNMIYSFPIEGGMAGQGV
jgi:copper oxidase (laccase) domain-containing protein